MTDRPGWRGYAYDKPTHYYLEATGTAFPLCMASIRLRETSISIGTRHCRRCERSLELLTR